MNRVGSGPVVRRILFLYKTVFSTCMGTHGAHGMSVFLQLFSITVLKRKKNEMTGFPSTPNGPFVYFTRRI